MKIACGIDMLESYHVKLLILSMYTFLSYIVVVHNSKPRLSYFTSRLVASCLSFSSFSFQTCYKCCRGDLCNSYIPGLDFSGSDSGTLSIGGVLMASVVLATRSSTMQ